MSEQSGRKKLSRKRIIGVLGDELCYEMPITIFRTLKKLTEKKDIEIYYYMADELKSHTKKFYQSNILYNFISPDVIDGLLITSNLLLSHISPEEFINRYRHYREMPTISIGLPLPGIPSVLIDNKAGVSAAISHLIDKHHYTRIGFLNGSLQHPDNQLRFQAYSSTIQAHNLPVNQALILQGNFQLASGIQAVKELIEIRQQIPGRDIDALVCANDFMARGVHQELLKRGYRIPEDIAVVGFDDMPFAQCLIPTLSSIRYPVDKMTIRAFELLLDLLNHKPVPQTTIIPAEFIARNSCGCIKPPLLKTDSPIFINFESPDFSADISNLQNLSEQISNAPPLNIDIWQDVFAFIQAFTLWQKNNPEDSTAAYLAGKANSLLISTINRSFKNTDFDISINNLSLTLNTAIDLAEILQILVQRLPRIGIRRCCIILYENPAALHDPESLPPWSNLILAYHEKDGQMVKAELPPGGLRFPTIALIPAELKDQYSQLSWNIVVLFFRQEQIGFLLLDPDAFNETTYHVLKLQVSSCLKASFILKEHRERSRELAAANAKIKEFNKRLKDENLHIKMEMEVAQRIQTALLPQNIKNIHPDFEIASLMMPAEDVGGDYFDILLDKEKHLWFGIGDVSGHGLKAGLIMMIAQSAQITILSNYKATPRDLIIKINNAMLESVTKRMKQNQYMTCAILKYLEQGRFQYAGMHPGFLIYRHKQKTCDEVILSGVWLNIMQEIGKVTHNAEFFLGIGDVLVLYTDGITEVANEEDKLLDTDGLKALIVRHGEKGIEEMLCAIKEDVMAYDVGIDKDDMTLIVVRRIQ